MRTITKTFVQVYVSNDCEARNWKWVDEKKGNYEDLKNELMTEWNGWFDGVRVVEKIFDEKTFTIKEKIVKEAKRAYEGFRWAEGEINETIY